MCINAFTRYLYQTVSDSNICISASPSFCSNFYTYIEINIRDYPLAYYIGV